MTEDSIYGDNSTVKGLIAQHDEKVRQGVRREIAETLLTQPTHMVDIEGRCWLDGLPCQTHAGYSDD